MHRRLRLRLNYYNIPRKIRELQCQEHRFKGKIIITYQEKLGNYNEKRIYFYRTSIITYQEKLGNYNSVGFLIITYLIITYQEKLGNYNLFGLLLDIKRL